MEYVFMICCIALVCGAVPNTKHSPAYGVQPSDVSDLESYNCNTFVLAGPCTGCGLNECYETSSITGTTFPQDGFCAVFNLSQPITTGVNRYSVSGRICLSSPNYPQGTGLLFNYQNDANYETVYKTRQDSTFCYYGYVQVGRARQVGSFDCGTTTADQWHRYTVTVYSDNTFEATLSTQGGSSTTSPKLPTYYSMSTRGGALMTNDGSPGKVLQFDEITMTLSSIDECASSPCGSGGSCIDDDNSYTCSCFPGYTGGLCETGIDECSSSPCGSGGSCVDGSGSYTCKCSPGYTGVRCETNINECLSSPCGSGGSCVDGIYSYTCNCYPGYTGVFCDSALPPVIYFLEWSNSGGNITNLTTGGVQNRITTSGGSYEQGLAIDVQSKLLFYATEELPKAVWRAEMDNLAGTKTQIWVPTTYTYGLDVSPTDKLVFADDSSSVAMLSYDGTLISRLSVAKSFSYGLAVDESQRNLYFTDFAGGKLWKVPFSPTSFIGSASIILDGTGTGLTGRNPSGLVLDGTTLFWVLYATGEIRTMPVNGSSSTIVELGEGTSGYNTCYLTKKGDYLYYTRQVSDGGVYSILATGGTREKITTSIPTLETMGIDVY